MEQKLSGLYDLFNELESKNISLYMKNVKQIKKNVNKLEVALYNLCKEDKNEEDEDEDVENDDDDNDEEEEDIDIDKQLEDYSTLINSINSDTNNNLESKPIEELVQILKQIELFEKQIVSYKNKTTDLNIKNI
jgi:hypothetical protein